MESNMPKILVVDDEEYTRTYFKDILDDQGYDLVYAHDGDEALKLWSRENFDLIIMDIRMPVIDGMEALRRIRSTDTETLIIMISAYGDIDSVIDAMRLGANDFFIKPFSSIDKIRLDIQNCFDRRKLLQEIKMLKRQINDAGLSSHQLIYTSAVMHHVIRLSCQASNIDLPVLILGESGTGKELIARSIHINSLRHAAPFFAVNCGALAETLLEPALFGYERGAFTGANATTIGYFEAVRGGTIFLDEIGETSPAFQVKLLRVLQENEIMRVGGTKPIKVDFRLISATNSNLDEQVRNGLFRKDLFYRINVVRIDVPPLRDRPEDIPLLLEHFLDQVCRTNRLKRRSLAPETIQHLMGLPWEGNVRELRNLVERLMIVSGRGTITLKELPKEYRNLSPAYSPEGEMPLIYDQARTQFEVTYLKRLLSKAGNNLKTASRLSGLELSTLYRRKYRLAK